MLYGRSAGIGLVATMILTERMHRFCTGYPSYKAEISALLQPTCGLVVRARM